MPSILHNANLFVISGGPGAGKTTVLRELQSLGFPVVPEAARQIIQEQVQISGTALPWLDREQYTQLMLQRSIESFVQHTPAHLPTFSDRGIPDTLCYARLIGSAAEEEIAQACRQYRYATTAFLTPPWKEIYETDNERKQDFAEATETFALMRTVYEELGYEVVEMPRATPRVRAEFILSCLNVLCERDD